MRTLVSSAVAAMTLALVASAATACPYSMQKNTTAEVSAPAETAQAAPPPAEAAVPAAGQAQQAAAPGAPVETAAVVQSGEAPKPN